MEMVRLAVMRMALSVLLATLFLGANLVTANAEKAKTNSNSAKQTSVLAKAKNKGDVYLLRGFGNVFSRGLDQIGAKLKKRGIDAEVVHHGDWNEVLSTIIANRKKYGRRPVVLIGHSLGANAILRIATALKKKRIKVQYMVTFAATNPVPVPSNVRKLTNYYFATDGWGKKIAKGRGFRGNLKNIDFSNSKTVGHFNIDKQPRLQRQVINNVLRFVKPKNRAELSVEVVDTKAG